MRDSIRLFTICLAIASAAMAQVTTYSTGMSSPSGTATPVPLAGGSNAQNYIMYSMPGKTYAYGYGLPTGWAANTGSSAWVTPQANSFTDVPAGHQYWLETHFSLTGLNLAQVNIQIQIAGPCGAISSINWNTGPTPPCNGTFSSTFTVPTAFLQQNDNLMQIRYPVAANGYAGMQVKVLVATAGSTQIGFYSTGVNDSRVALATGTADTHWKLVSRPLAVSVDNSPIWAYWLLNSASNQSKWITPEADPMKAYPPGTYVFYYWFNLPNFNPATQTATITGSWAADNLGVISVNDVDQPSTQLSDVNTAFTGLHPFTITNAPLVAGGNAIKFKVTNTGTVDNPVGLRVDDFKITIQSTGCTSTANVTSTATNLQPLPITTGPNGPAGDPSGMGGSYCDPVFGNQVVRITDTTISQFIDPFQRLGFNKNSTKFAAMTDPGAAIRVYDFNPANMAVSNPQTIALPNAINSDVAVWSGSSETSAPNNIIYAGGMKIYKYDLTNNTITSIADLTNATSGGQSVPAGSGMLRVSASKWAADGSVTLAASLNIPGKTNGGYVAFKILKMSKGVSDPATWDKNNFSVKAMRINAPNDLNGFQTITRVSPSNQTTYQVRMASDVAGGYKCAIDRSGNFLIHEAVYVADGGTTGDMNAKVVIDLQAAETAVERYRFLLYAGHSTQGDGVEYGHNTAGYAPNGTCILCRKKWVYSTLTTDPRACNTKPVNSPPDNPNTTPSLVCGPNDIGSNLPNSQGSAISQVDFWGMRGDYAHVPIASDGTWVGFLYGCLGGDCSSASNKLFNGEIVMMKTDGTNAANPAQGFKRVAHTRLSTAGFSEGQAFDLLWKQAPVLSPDGQFFAFVSSGKYPAPTNLTDPLAVYAVRVPQ